MRIPCINRRKPIEGNDSGLSHFNIRKVYLSIMLPGHFLLNFSYRTYKYFSVSSTKKLFFLVFFSLIVSAALTAGCSHRPVYHSDAGRRRNFKLPYLVHFLLLKREQHHGIRTLIGCRDNTAVLFILRTDAKASGRLSAG